MKRTTWLYAICVVALNACDDSPTEPDEIAVAPSGTVEEVAAYLPAVDDLSARILTTGGDQSIMVQITTHMTEIMTALNERYAQKAERALVKARALLDSCDDDCLAAADRGVVDLTLDYAALLIGPDGGNK
jgi:sulfur transfer complex TusBCD TusB component (DsrH family)